VATNNSSNTNTKDLNDLLNRPIALDIPFSVVSGEARIVGKTYPERLGEYLVADEKVVGQIRNAVERR